MAEVIDKLMITYQVGNLMNEANEFVYIICPFIKMRDFAAIDLDSNLYKNIQVHIVYGKQKMDKDAFTFFSQRENVTLYYCKDLHSKIYLNDQYGIICSMNLYEFSIQNNIETGVYFKRYEDLYSQCQLKVKNILRHSVKAQQTILSS